MARPKKTDAPDLGETQDLTAGLIERMACPAGKLQTFMRDSKAPGLRVRATTATAKNPNGVKAFVFEAKLNRQTIRRTIGDVRAWTIDAARIEANRLRVTLEAGTDPRELDRAKVTAAADALTVAEIWTVYLAERRPHWGERPLPRPPDQSRTWRRSTQARHDPDRARAVGPIDGTAPAQSGRGHG